MLPKFNEFFPYILKILENNEVKTLKELRDQLAIDMNISKEQREILLASKVQTVYDNRVGWALGYLSKGGILEKPERAKYKLSKKGQEYIKKNGYDITVEYLKTLKEFQKFMGAGKNDTSENEENIQVDIDDEETPDDIIGRGIVAMNTNLSTELLNEISKMSPKFFEFLVLDLLQKMGYGGSINNSTIHTGDGPDDGIDGIIKEDELGLDHIYVQAKRWLPQVGQPKIQEFVGALSGKGAIKGVFITTSTFSKKAIEYSNSLKDYRIVLIDGEKLTELMINYGVGLTTEHIYKIQKIDTDYFEE